MEPLEVFDVDVVLVFLVDLGVLGVDCIFLADLGAL